MCLVLFHRPMRLFCAQQLLQQLIQQYNVWSMDGTKSNISKYELSRPNNKICLVPPTVTSLFLSLSPRKMIKKCLCHCLFVCVFASLTKLKLFQNNQTVDCRKMVHTAHWYQNDRTKKKKCENWNWCDRLCWICNCGISVNCVMQRILLLRFVARYFNDSVACNHTLTEMVSTEETSWNEWKTEDDRDEDWLWYYLNRASDNLCCWLCLFIW